MSGRKCAECGEVHLAGENGAIYCCGSLLQAVQLSGMFSDSKYFVDMATKYSLERTIADWQLFCSSKRNDNSLKHLVNFVENHFDKPNCELICYCPSDWQENPEFVSMVNNQELKHFAMLLNALWKSLGRHMKDSVRTNPSNYSLVYVPNLSIVPGGRFQEFYYWDTYFIVRGLLHSGMVQTARGMLDNLLYLVHEYKFVPNGGRVYYWGRSQPPLLVAMVKAYVEATNDKKYAQSVVPLLDIEMENFMRSHAVEVKGRLMYQYRDKSSGPRPEAYREDVKTAMAFETEDEKEFLYSNLKAACESGQNFSSRWFITDDGSNRGTLSDTKTSWIVPVDLNCIIFRNCKTIAEFYTMAGNTVRAEYYRELAGNLIKAITAVLWNEARGIWLDYDLKNDAPRDFFAVTNFTPLWTHAYPIHSTDTISDSLMAYIAEHQLESFPGGVPQTLYNSGEQWDYPNVWPAMTYMLTEGLNNLGTLDAQSMAQRLRDKMVYAAYKGYKANGTLFDKYNCEETGAPGTGGEYGTQTGSGLTNGVLIELLARYGQQSSVAYEEEEIPITSVAYLERASAEQQQNYYSNVGSQEMMSYMPQIQVLPIAQPADDCDGPFSDPTSLCSICNPKPKPCACAEPPAAPSDDDCTCSPPPCVQPPTIPSPKGKSGGCPPKPVSCCPPPPCCQPCCPPAPKKASPPPCPPGGTPPCPPAKAPCPPRPPVKEPCPPQPPAKEPCPPQPPAKEPCPPQPPAKEPCPPQPKPCCPPPKKVCPPQPCPPPCPPPAKPPCPPKAEIKEFCSICNCVIPQEQVEQICSACNQAQEEAQEKAQAEAQEEAEEEAQEVAQEEAQEVAQEEEPEPCPPKPCPPQPCPPKAKPPTCCPPPRCPPAPCPPAACPPPPCPPAACPPPPCPPPACCPPAPCPPAPCPPAPCPPAPCPPPACCPPPPCPPEPCPPKPCPPKPCPPEPVEDCEESEAEESPKSDCPPKALKVEDCSCAAKPLPSPKVMPKGPSPVPWKPAKLDCDECAESEPESCVQEEQEDDELCCCDEPKKPKRKSGNGGCDDEPEVQPCCCNQPKTAKCDSEDDEIDGTDGEEGCPKVEVICSGESQKAPQNKVFPLDDDAKPCSCEPPSQKRPSKGCN